VTSAPDSDIVADEKPQAVHRAPGEGATVRNPVGGTFKLRGQQSNGMLLVLESVAAPGESASAARARR
jgi:hypothetical protein